MIEDKDLQALVGFSGTQQVLSVYLDTDLSVKSKDAVKLMLKERVKKGFDEAPQDTANVQKYLDLEFDWQSKGLAIFSSGDELWKVIPLPIAVISQAYLADRPYVRILTDLLDRFASYGVALVDRESIRLFMVAWGKIEPRTEAFGEELKRHKQGGWAASRYQRHEDNLALHNLKSSVDTLQRFCEISNCQRVVLGGSSEVLSQVTELLSTPMQERVMGQFTVDMTASTAEILDRSLEVIAQVDLDEEQAIVLRAITAAAKGRAGVTGLADTLPLLHQGRVRVLMVEETYSASGYVCGHCGYVATEHAAKCPLCAYDAMAETPDVVNVAIHKAIETGAEVNIVRDNPELDRAGGIAALLRY